MSEDIYISQFLIDTDDYEIGTKLGKGGCGVVFRAREKTTNKEYALKCLFFSEKMIDAKQQQCFLREVIVPCMINVPGIVHLKGFRFPLTKTEIDDLHKSDKGADAEKGKTALDIMKDEKPDLSSAIIVTELMPNSSLDVINNKYIDSSGKDNTDFGPTERSKIIFGVALTMSVIHKKNIIHRDIKLENIFLDENYEPRIADFGLAKVMSPDIDMTMAIGTPIYMAPEIFSEGPETYDVSVDVYAFGMMLYQMFINGKRGIKFDDNKPYRSPQQLMMKVMKGARPVKLDCIPQHYWELIKACWANLPKDRPSFENIVEILQDDKFMLEEFGKKTDRAKLREYMKRMLDYVAETEKKETATDDDFGRSMKTIKDLEKIGGSVMKIIDKKETTTGVARKMNFNWHRH